ncbi:MAG TPA: flagellar basal body P-ring formation chaperone FlgA [Tepidisphaeraceae bacterium]|jgi:flagella basal body P-ring formation protein FlgA|nr:flagellar basal body P-ring formation chaperone FlgA [Tepidisphaeraceae bacterium]
MYGNGRPLGMRKRIQVLIAVVLLAWATQTLLRQWGYGAEIAQSNSGESFVPGTDRFIAGATLEMRGDATIVGAEVKLRQICRWSGADAEVFAPVADLVIARINPRAPFRSISVEQIRNTLRDAGVNLGVVKFAGPISCTITRSDADYDEQSGLRQWAAAKSCQSDDEPQPPPQQQDAKIAPDPVFASASVKPPVAAAVGDGSPVKTLRSLLVDDLSTRLGIAAEGLEINFNPKDENLLHLSEPLFKFNIEPRQVQDLGEVSWNVLILSGSGSQRGTIKANVRAWQNEIVLAKPLAYHQVIRPSDVAARRTLADRLPSDPLLTMAQVVGQEAARELKVGTVLSARMVDAMTLVKPGQLVTISLSVGSVSVKTVGRAMETGSYGQTVKVRNDATQDIYEVTMTGPQEGTMGPLPPAGAVAESR